MSMILVKQIVTVFRSLHCKTVMGTKVALETQTILLRTFFTVVFVCDVYCFCDLSVKLGD